MTAHEERFMQWALGRYALLVRSAVSYNLDVMLAKEEMVQNNHDNGIWPGVKMPDKNHHDIKGVLEFLVRIADGATYGDHGRQEQLPSFEALQGPADDAWIRDAKDVSAMLSRMNLHMRR